MATFNATEYAAAYVNSPATKQLPTVYDGRVRIKWFTIPAITGLAQNDLVNLCKLPANARVVAGRIDFDDYGTAITLDIGYSGAENRYLSALDIATAAGQANFADTTARNMGDLLTAEKVIQAKFEGGDPSDTSTARGYILYVLD